jgi:diadenosine tetraphosphate (Ap4A) HIT family hydrolase
MFFEDHKIGNVEHLHIHVQGELKDDRNKLHIDYEGKSYFGCKILPKFREGTTLFMVYIYQEGDSEL